MSDGTRSEPAFERIGGYRVLRRIATGGTSEVLLARAEGPGGFGRMVVLKRQLAEYKNDPAYERMFAREASAYARLSHPAIVKLYDFYSLDGRLVMVLEYVDGLPLNRLRASLRGLGYALNDRAAIYVVSRIFAALAAAHGAREVDSGQLAPVIHRDVNPSNVLVPWDGHVKLGDFGVAKVAGMPGDTQTGLIKGTYGYMAPEQVKGEEVTVRADVYAGALILWELLARRKAIQRGALPEVEVLRAMAEPSFVSLDVLRPDVDKSVREAVQRGLEPQADKRTITAEEMAAVLKAAAPPDAGREALVEALTLARPASENPTIPDPDASVVEKAPVAPVQASDVEALAKAFVPRAPAHGSVRMRAAAAVSAPGAPAPPARPAAPGPRPPVNPFAATAAALPAPTTAMAPNAPAPNVPAARAPSGARIAIASLTRTQPGSGARVPAAAPAAPAREARAEAAPPASEARVAAVPATPSPTAQPALAGRLPPPTFDKTVPRGASPSQAPTLAPAGGTDLPTDPPVPRPPRLPGSTPSPSQPTRHHSPVPPPPGLPPAFAMRSSPAGPPRHALVTAVGAFLVSLAVAGGFFLWIRSHLVMPAAVAPATAASIAPPAFSEPSAHSAPAPAAPPSAAASPPPAATPPPATQSVAAAAGVPPPAPTPSARVAVAPPPTPPAPPSAAPPAAPQPESAGGTSGDLVTREAQSGRRIFVDGHVMGQTPETLHLKCGPHRVKVGSSGTEKTVDVPCGGEVSVR